MRDLSDLPSPAPTARKTPQATPHFPANISKCKYVSSLRLVIGSLSFAPLCNPVLRAKGHQRDIKPVLFVPDPENNRDPVVRATVKIKQAIERRRQPLSRTRVGRN